MATGPEVTVRIGEVDRDLHVEGRTVADVAARWTALLSVPTDLSGRIAGWYCIEQGGERLQGSAAAAVIDTSRVVDLVFEPNHTRLVTVEAPGNVRFQAPVGLATPAGSLLAHLVGWLELGGGAFTLHADGKALGPSQVLAEAAPDVSVLEVKA
ncbi:MAG: hypothetical protein EP330_04295 [Deltaproteobacteria bacterium]|nr:MAG: hypothetical protein EP330_04295 [Deltaproteobacteria bacterium]